LWPGIVATLLATVAAWYLFIPPFHVWRLDTHELVQLLLFLFISAINVAIAAALSTLVDRLIIQQRNIRLLLDSAPNGFVLVDGVGTIRLANASTAKLFGYKPEELVGKDVEVLVPGRQADGHRRQRTAYQGAPEVRPMGLGRDLSGRRKDGSELPVEIGLNPVGQEGRPAVLATVIDISARKRAEEAQRLLMRELDHRTRNLFAVVLALVSTSGQQSRTVDHLVQELTGRIHAVSKTYALFSSSSDGISFGDVLSAQISAHPGRIGFEGDDVSITAKAAEHFTLILHELATNALKYGSLSTVDGRVTIDAKVRRHSDGALLIFSWKEVGGPPVAPPNRQGFGTLILHDMARQFCRHVLIDYLPDGFHYQLHADLAEIEFAQEQDTRKTA
jgi:PAS domain S-box-containing protein